NLILDALLNDYAKRFFKINSKFESSAFIKIDDMSELDLIKLFYNILENAYEALLKVDASLRTLEIKSERVQGYIKISFMNTTDKMLDLSEKTSKRDKKNHGFGKSIIDDILSNHDGFSNAFITINENVYY